MSDGSGGGGLSGTFEFIGDKAKQGAKAVGNAASTTVKTAVGQVTGNQTPSSSPGGMLAGEFIPGEVGKSASPQHGATAGSHTISSQQAMQNSQNAVQDKSRIAEIEKELEWHKEHYFKPFLEKAEGRDRQAQIDAQNKANEAQHAEVKKMQDLQKQQEKQKPLNVQQAIMSRESKSGDLG